ncbi:class I tRNA ligase family protein [Pseudomonas asplenii]|uniref:class I tRNA ligase family protein n=1 Tax=Pseudomonas asplenii TaxID=53407 RepID=UPI00035DE7CA|nr:class I tRNA ligase family protein [Pseudomonas fuscovaginae]
MTDTQKTYFVCPAPPCPNGKLHLGHIAGVYLLTDIYVRFQRLAGHRAFHITGSDEHGTYTLVKAQKLQRPVDEVAQMHNREILACLGALGIEPDEFVRTSSADHIDNSLAIYRALKDNGYITFKDGVQLYCEACAEFAADSLASGICPDCSAPTDSNLCENCGLAVPHARLKQPRHAPCSGPLTLRPIRQAHLDTEKLAPALQRAIGDSQWPATIKDLELTWLRETLRSLPMSRHFERGVVLDEPEAVAGQTLLTWFEGLWCFDTGIHRRCAREGLDYQQTMSSPDTRVVFFMGQDNRFYYTVGVTASLLGRGLPAPYNQSIQDFSTLEGSKFSTSRDHVIWADEVAEVIDPNILRLYLASIAKPFGNQDNAFELEGLMAAARKLHVWEASLRAHADEARQVVDEPLPPYLAEQLARYTAAMNGLAFWDALRAIDEFLANADITLASPRWQAGQVSALLGMLAPFIPDWVQRYATLYFGPDWAPASPALSLPALPLPAAAFPMIEAQIPDHYIRAYKQRFRAATTA